MEEAYYSIALTLNVLLTLMLITRLVLHSKGIRTAMGAQDEGGLYNVIMLIESDTIYAASFVLVVGPRASKSAPVQVVTSQIFPEVQVRIVFPLHWPTQIPGRCPTMTTNSVLLRSSSFFGSQTGLH